MDEQNERCGARRAGRSRADLGALVPGGRGALWPLCLPVLCCVVGCTSQAPSSPEAATAERSTASRATSFEQPAAVDEAGVPSDATRQTSSLTAQQVLERAAAAYGKAASYADQGVLRQVAELAGQQVDEQAEFSLAFMRPGKLRLHVYQAGVVCDGRTFRATLGDLPGQVLELEAPAELTYDFVYQEPTLTSVLAGGLAGSSPPLALLLTADALPGMMAGAQPPVLLPPAEFDGAGCYRVELVRADGSLVFWVDQQSFVVRRIDYPTEGLRKQYAQQGQVGRLELWAEFRQAALNVPIDEVAFTFEAPPAARSVKRLVMLPEPPAPSALLGQAIGNFQFRDLQGQLVDLASLAGKVVVLDFWATWCQPCLQSLPSFDQVYRQFAQDERVKFLAVSVDAPETPTERLSAMFQEHDLTAPIVRDDGTQARDVFGVPGIPNLFLVGPTGRVEHNEIGFNPQLADELAKHIERLLRGESLFAETQAKYQAKLAEYRRDLAAQEEAAAAEDGVPRAHIAPADEPKTLTRELLWSNSEIKRPGNVLLVPRADGTERLLVIEGFKGVVELDEAGKITAREALDLPQSAVVSYLRTAVDRAGRRMFLGSAVNQSLLHVFDDRWQRLLSYPSGENVEVMDAQWVDLNGDGQLELAVGFWGVVGVQGVSLEGRRLWHNRSVENVFRLAVDTAADGAPRILVAQARGTLVPLDAAGQHGPDVPVSGRFLRHVLVADLDHDGRAEYAGLAATGGASEDLLGLSAQGSELWSYNLPPGVHEQPIEMLSSGPLLAGTPDCWIAAAADGSLHFLAADGQLVDRWHHGTALCGVATAAIDNQVLLVVSTPERVEAWRLSPR